jgi:inhibitor of nuclear factor kappa-B kinase subunit alpha
MMKYTLEQRIFLYDSYVKRKSYKSCKRRFLRKYPGVRVPASSTIFKLVKKVRSTGSVLDKKYSRQNAVLTEEVLDEIGARLEHSPPKSLARLAQEVKVSTTTAWKATKILHLLPYKITQDQAIEEGDCQRRIHFCNWFLRAVHDGILDPKLTFFTDEAWFHLSGYINAQNSKYWSNINPRQTSEVPLHDQKIGVWCAISAARIVGPIFFEETINSERYVSDILQPFFESITEEEKTYGYFMQDGATAHIATYSIHVLNKVFEDRLISRGLWPARSPDLNPCDFYLWESLKDKVYSSNPHTLDELKQSIHETITSVKVNELKLVSNNLFKRLELCLRAEGRHFEHLL